jgi:hypothetical protein
VLKSRFFHKAIYVTADAKRILHSVISGNFLELGHIILYPANSSAAVMMLEHLFVAFNYSSHKLDHLTRFSGSDVLDHPVERSRCHGMKMVFPAALLEGK